MFLKKFSQNIAIDHEGMIYGKTKIVDNIFLNGILVLEIKNASVPPTVIAIKHANKAIKIDLPIGIQNKFCETLIFNGSGLNSV